ncbi:hypothetical protein KSI01_27310 [Kurthia sibirica]|nr:hypothetical protein KSI01_27310 [Kurthia sibirica]
MPTELETSQPVSKAGQAVSKWGQPVSKASQAVSKWGQAVSKRG